MPPRGGTAWGRLDSPQRREGIPRNLQFPGPTSGPRREAFAKSDLAVPQLAGLLLSDLKCRLVTVSACRRSPAPLRGGVFAVLGSVGAASLSKPVAMAHPCACSAVLFISHIYRKPKHLSLGLAGQAAGRLQRKGKAEGREGAVCEPSLEGGWPGQGRRWLPPSSPAASDGAELYLKALSRPPLWGPHVDE